MSTKIELLPEIKTVRQSTIVKSKFVGQDRNAKVNTGQANQTNQACKHLDSFYKHFWQTPDHCCCRDENGNDIGDDKCRGECRELPWYTNMEDEYAYMDFLLNQKI